MKTRFWFVSFAVLATTVDVSAAPTWQTFGPGVRRWHTESASPKTSMDVMEVNLCAGNIAVRATMPTEKGRTTSSFGSLVGADIAINGDFFSSSFAVNGLAVGNGVVWPGTADNPNDALIAFGDNRAEIYNDEATIPTEPWMKNAVSGHWTLLVNGAVKDNDSDYVLCDAVLAPRTAVGLSIDKEKLYIAVVDGRNGYRGMRCSEVGALLKEAGAWNALGLDGGGSSTLWLKSAGGVVNHPSGPPAGERVVANHLAIYTNRSSGTGSCPRVVTPGRDAGTPNDAAVPNARDGGSHSPGGVDAISSGGASSSGAPNSTESNGDGCATLGYGSRSVWTSLLVLGCMLIAKRRTRRTR